MLAMAPRAVQHEKGRRWWQRPVAATSGVALAVSLAALGCAGRAKTPTPSPSTISRASAPVATRGAIAPLKGASADFHAEYAAARARQQATLGVSRPYLFLGAEKLVLRYHG